MFITDHLDFIIYQKGLPALISLFYNLLMLAFDLGALGILRRRRTVWVALAALAGVGLVAFFLALTMGHSFLRVRLLAYGIFLHALVMLVGCGILLWKTSRPACLMCVVLAVLLAAVAVDAFLLEPVWLEVNRYRIVSNKLSGPLRIVVIADLQTDVIGPYERRALERAMAERPDLILLAGDYLQEDDPARRERLQKQLNKLLHEMKFGAPHGVYAVAGNTDGWRWSKIFAGLDVEILSQSRSVVRGDLQITGLTLRDSFDPHMKIAASEKFHIVLGHAPDFALGRIDADLLVAGHTHGGQVRLPFYGPPVTLSRVPRRWAAGLTDLDGGRKLLVSRGVGMERGDAPRLRFLCRPELVVLELNPE